MRKHAILTAAAATLALFASFAARADYSNTVRSLNPIAYWPLNETTPPGTGVTTATNIGTLGTALNGAFSGNVTFGVASSLASDSDTSDRFDGSTAIMQTPYTAAALSNAPSFTIEALIFSHTPAIGTQCALSDLNAGATRSGWLLYIDGNNPGQYNFRMYNQNGGTPSLNLNIGAASSINADQWYHVAIVVSNAITATNVYAYINGVLTAGPVACPSFVPSDGGQGGFTVGARNDAGFRFNGSIDEVAYYPTALTPATIASHYTAATTVSPPTPYKTMVLASSPSLYFRLDEPNNLPIAHSYGTLGAAANGYYQAGTVPGVAGPNFSGLANGFGPNNFACQFSPGAVHSSNNPGPGVACAPYNVGLLDDQTTLTVSAWIKVPATSVGWFTGVMGRGDSSYRFGLDQSGLPRFADGGGGNGDITGSTAINDGSWHLWTGVYNSANSNAALYIDTTLAGTATWNPPGGNSTTEFFIGGAPDYVDRNFVGTISQVAIFTNALTGDQVKQTYYSAAPSQFSQAVASLNPVAYWPLNETNQPPAEATPVPLSNLGTLGSALDATLNSPDDLIYGYPGALASSTDTSDSFNGKTTIAQAPYTGDLANPPSFTVEAWLKAHDDGAIAGTMCALSDVDAGGTRSGWLLYLDIANVGQYTFRAYDQNGGTPSLSLNLGAAGSILKEQWNHVVIVVSNAITATNIYGYINGALVAGPVALPTYVPNDGAAGGFSIGARADNGFLFNGAIDEVAYYTNALNPATVLSHYQAGTNPTPVTAYSAQVLQQHPILYYRMDQVPTALAGPYLVPLPVAANYGSLGAGGNGYYQPGTTPGIAGPTNAGFGLSSLACAINPAGNPSTAQNGPGIMCAPYQQAALNFTQSLSVAAWVQVPAAPFWFQSVLGRGDNSYRFDVDPTSAGGFPHFAAAPNGDLIGTTALADNIWHYWVGVFDQASSTSSLYIDGLLAASAPGSPLTELTEYFMIGGVPDYDNRNFVGNICHVAIFSNALAQAQVQNLYNSIGAPPLAFLPTNAFTINQGANGGITAAIAGTPPLTIQWYFIDTGNVTNVAVGQTSNTLSIVNAQPTQNGNQYFVVVNNAYGTTTSSVATLTVVQGPPTIQVDIAPLLQAVPAGVSITYSVDVTGTLPFHYQWIKNGSPISGATSSSLTFLAPGGSNVYNVTITNSFGSATSSLAVLIGLTNPPPVVTFNINGSDWTTNNPPASIANGTLLLTDGNNGEATSAFYNFPQYIGGFVTFYTYQEANGSAPLADGATFCVQNASLGAAAVGGGGGELGFTGIQPSAAFEMNIYNGANGGIGIQFGTNGMTADSPTPTPPYFATSPVNMAGGNPINVRLYYSQGVFYLNLVDTVSSATYSTSYNMPNLPAVVGGAAAYIGFTGATGGLNSIQTISNFRFSYTTPPVLGVSVNGANAVVTWPVSVATFFTLQHSASVNGPWTNVGITPTVINGQNTVSVPATGGAQFFRLVLQ